MEHFVNRSLELSLIDDAFEDLLNEGRRVRTPIVDFYGVEGIGKSSILRQIVQKCTEKSLSYIQADVNPNISIFSQLIIEQTQKYLTPTSISHAHVHEGAFEQSIELTKDLLEQGPLVMILDSFDPIDDDQVAIVEKMLGKLLFDHKLFVVLASRRSISFEQDRNVARNLKIYQLHPLDRAHSKEYLELRHHALPPAIIELILEWTRGYPLAMDVMLNAVINQGIDPTVEQGKLTLISLITERVITNSLLAKVNSSERNWFNITLNLFAVPRRCNLVIMQKLIEKFEPALKLPNSLAYIVLPKRIFQATGIFSWNMVKAGFTIDEPVRGILLLALKTTNPERYYALNEFLAALNWSSASESTGLDRIRYQREYLYHSSNSTDTQQLPAILEKTVQQIIQDSEAFPDQLIQFCEEFSQDDELQTDLGAHATIVLSLVYKEIAQKLYNMASKETDKGKRIRYLHSFIDYTILDPSVTDLPTVLKELVLQLIAQEDPGLVLALYEQLGQSDVFINALATDFPILFQLIRDNISAEG